MIKDIIKKIEDRINKNNIDKGYESLGGVSNIYAKNKELEWVLSELKKMK